MPSAKGERPNLRRVREAIPTGGSPREVCRHLRAWRKKRGYNPKLEPTDMSKAMKEAGQALAMALWKQAKREAAASMASDDKQDREHLIGMVETLHAGNAALAARAILGTAAFANGDEDHGAPVQGVVQIEQRQGVRFRAGLVRRAGQFRGGREGARPARAGERPHRRRARRPSGGRWGAALTAA
ncbi:MULTISPECIES: DNA-binding protein [Methylobacterium]|jgi:hypothetical protein|uniref:KfrA N-terminal DNA-binding domain-containing protein n=2 Tax=Methylobacterium TaxID=407 RepID=A0AA37HD73_9HYPH|nr:MULTISPECIES: DNA-binding protein [Methylobacterium]TGD97918.1 hypothetical protein EU555_17260 [Methylobacterium nonmethylotrophicum]GJD63409.1 hypothetical protein MPEAHAMD_3577 [Methylobacterium frigidaeris]